MTVTGMPRLHWNSLPAILTFLFVLHFWECSAGTGIEPLQRQAFRNLRSTECTIDCSSVKTRSICGSDGITYSSRCEIRRAKQCEGVNVSVKKKGQCSNKGDKKSLTRCQQERVDAVAVARRPTVGIFIPACNPDGTYASIQCHAATGYCWCATKAGKPISGTSLSEKKPNCKGKPKTTRGNKNGKRGGCSQMDRSTFNTNLIAVFTEEYMRIVNQTLKPPESKSKSSSDSVLDTPNKRVVEWKFSQLDRNSDNKLRKKEVRALKRMVKKLIKPRTCAKNFVNYCDLDQDKKIIPREWSLCLGVTINRVSVLKSQAFKSFGFSSLLRPSNSDDATDERQNPTSPRASPGAVPLAPSLGNRQLNQGPSQSTTESNKADNTQELRGCLEERRIAIGMDKEDPEGKIFIPTCTSDGKFEKAQCHKSTQFCWCVDDTGRPKPGTSTFKVIPNCDIPDERRMKGCPTVQKRRFVKDLLDYLAVEMEADTGVNIQVTPGVRDKVFYENVVKWKLNSLDRNKNKLLERKEWKSFKKAMRKNVGNKKSLRKCSRNFLRYCDSDKSKKISMEEWIDCTGVHRNMFSLPPNPKRKGPNPFIQQLCC